MHTIPLWEPSPAAGPDGWHRMTAPGGYEGWWFDAVDANAGIRLIIAFFIGDPFSKIYLADYRRFRRWPTRFAPPRPVDHCAIYASVSEKNQPTWKLVARPGADAFHVFETESRFELKDVASWKFGEGDTELEVRNADDGLIELALNVARASRSCISTGSTGETPVPQVKSGFHRWTVTSSSSHAMGEMSTSTYNRSPRRKIQFQGPCIEGHCMGNAPPIDRNGRPVIESEILKAHACLFELSAAKWIKSSPAA